MARSLGYTIGAMRYLPCLLVNYCFTSLSAVEKVGFPEPAYNVLWHAHRQKFRRNPRKNSLIFVDFFKKMLIIPICMDTMNDCKIPECGDLSQLAGKKIVVGAKQLRKALNSRRATAVYLARNADPALTEPLMELSRENGIPCVWARSMLDLGSACGIEVGAAAAAAVE
jgi:large subunit ribosomal protein L7A